MLILLLSSFAIAWIAVMVVMTTVCVSAARGDRALRSDLRHARGPQRVVGPVRLSA